MQDEHPTQQGGNDMAKRPPRGNRLTVAIPALIVTAIMALFAIAATASSAASPSGTSPSGVATSGSAPGTSAASATPTTAPATPATSSADTTSAAASTSANNPAPVTSASTTSGNNSPSETPTVPKPTAPKQSQHDPAPSSTPPSKGNGTLSVTPACGSLHVVAQNWPTAYDNIKVVIDGDTSGGGFVHDYDNTFDLLPENVGHSYDVQVLSNNGDLGADKPGTQPACAPKPAPTVDLSLNDKEITVGQSATLSWTSTHAITLAASGDWSGSKAVPSGTETVTPSTAGTYSYVLTASGAGGTATDTATVVVDPAPVVVTPEEPTSTAPGCTQTVTPSNQQGVQWHPAGSTTLLPGKSVTYTATPAKGYVFPKGTQTSFAFTDAFDAGKCLPPHHQPPVATDDMASTDENTAVTIDVLANDRGDHLTVVSVTDPHKAKIVNNAVVYTPAPGFSGTDRFGYGVRDANSGTATATVTVTVTKAASPPPVHHRHSNPPAHHQHHPRVAPQHRRTITKVHGRQHRQARYAGSGKLSMTGFSATEVAGFGALLLVGGLWCLRFGRRRKPQRVH